MRHLIINTYHGLTLCVLLTLFICSLSSRVYGQKSECIELAKLYQSSVKQYKVAARQYLTEGCQEAGSEKKKCRGLEAAAAELQLGQSAGAARTRFPAARLGGWFGP